VYLVGLHIYYTLFGFHYDIFGFYSHYMF
jgi:hypothetical protein